MIALHQRVRRTICRWAFCLLCLLPTAGVLAWSAGQKLPGHVRGFERRSSEQFGLRVSVGSLSYPRPGEMICHDLELAVPETGANILRAVRLETFVHESSLVVAATGLEVDAERVDPLWQWLLRRLRGESTVTPDRVRLAPSDVTWRMGERRRTFQPVVRGSLEIGETGGTARLDFRLPGDSSATPASINVTRAIHEGPPVTRFDLTTGGAKLPVDVFLPLGNLSAWLGPHSTFRGQFSAVETGGEWEGDITGFISGIDLDRLVGNHFPHKLTGVASAKIAKARFVRGRLVEASGTLNGGPGQVGNRLLAAARANLGGAKSRQGPAVGFVNYTELGVRFTIAGSEITLAGNCGGSAKASTLFLNPQGKPLLQVQGTHDVLALLRTLVPDSEVQVPASSETAWLVQVLPLPRVVPPRGADGRPPEPEARLHTDPAE